jgi:hypothetical protein
MPTVWRFTASRNAILWAFSPAAGRLKLASTASAAEDERRNRA